MAEDGKIVYKVVINSDGVVEHVENVGSAAGAALQKSASEHGGAFKEIMTGAARAIGSAFVEMAGKAVEGVKQIVANGIEFNAQMEQYQTAFTTLLGDADAAADAMAKIREDAARTPFNVESLTQANQALISAGLSADKAREDVNNLANAIAATGGGSAELSRMAANMQQIQNVGKATAMDIRQFANAGINIYGLLADSMGITAKEAAELDVTYEQLSEALAHAAEAGGMYEGAMEAQSQTFQGRLSTLQDNIAQLEGALTEDLFSKLSDTALPMVQDWIATLLEAAETGGIEGAFEAAKGILKELVNSLLDGLPDMLDAGATLLENLLKGIDSESVAETTKTILTFIGRILYVLADHFDDLLDAGIRACAAIIDGIVQALTGHSVAELWQAFTNFVGEIVQFWKDKFSEWYEIGVSIVEGIKQGISDMWSDLVNSVVTWGWDLIHGFIDGIVSGWNDLKGTLGAFGQKIADFIGFSEPKEGPLSNFHTFAPDMMELYAKGIEDNRKVVIEQLGKLAIDARETLTMDAISPDFSSAGLARAVSYDINSSRMTNNIGGAVYNINVNGIAELDEVVNWFQSRELVGRMA